MEIYPSLAINTKQSICLQHILVFPGRAGGFGGSRQQVGDRAWHLSLNLSRGPRGSELIYHAALAMTLRVFMSLTLPAAPRGRLLPAAISASTAALPVLATDCCCPAAAPWP